MQSANLENSLILVDIADAMLDYVSIQPDIDETKVKAASLMAQKMDIQRLIGKTNLERCINPQTEADDNLKDLIIPALCYFTQARLLKAFPGTFTESGYTKEELAENENTAKKVALEMSAAGETFMQDVFEFLETESPNDENVKEENLTPRIRVIGGKESFGSN